MLSQLKQETERQTLGHAEEVCKILIFVTHILREFFRKLSWLTIYSKFGQTTNSIVFNKYFPILLYLE